MSETRTDDILIAYDKKGQEVAQGIAGQGEVTINNLTPATSYAEGDFQVAFSNEDGVSSKVAVPAFVTKPDSAPSTVPASSAGSASNSTAPASSASSSTAPASSAK